MRKKPEREKLEELLAEIHEDVRETNSGGEVCLSPLLDVTVDDTEKGWTAEGDEYDELSS